jgi:Zn-dependent protease with chaperone function
MIRPLESSFEGRYYDGQTAVRQAAIVELLASGLQISAMGKPAVLWRYNAVRFATDGTYGEPVRIENAAGEAVVIEAHNFFEALQQHGVTRTVIPLDLRSWPAVMLCCIAIIVIGSVLYISGVRWAADQAARFMPAWMEDRLGRSVITVLAPEQARCADTEHLLQPVEERLRAEAGPKQRFQVIYVNQAVVNAFAAPGGYIVVFRGLLDQTETPEEFAGVLAHEMQHVLLRHSTRAIAREFSGRALLTLMAVDATGTPSAVQAAARLTNLSYQRSDEEAADLAGAALLARARVRTDGLATLLRRLEANPAGGLVAFRYLATHPATAERVDALEAETSRLSHTFIPLMTVEEWKTAREVCVGK